MLVLSAGIAAGYIHWDQNGAAADEIIERHNNDKRQVETQSQHSKFRQFPRWGRLGIDSQRRALIVALVDEGYACLFEDLYKFAYNPNARLPLSRFEPTKGIYTHPAPASCF